MAWGGGGVWEDLGLLGFWEENRAAASDFACLAGYWDENPPSQHLQASKQQFSWQAVPYGMSAALVGFLWVFSTSSEMSFVFTSDLPFGACIPLQSQGLIR